MRNAEESFDRVMQKYPGVVEKIKLSSEAGCTKIPDRSVDFVYLDGDHSSAALMEDISRFLPKIKPGGFLGGHDYNRVAWPGVVKAIESSLGRPDRIFSDTSWITQLDNTGTHH